MVCDCCAAPITDGYHGRLYTGLPDIVNGVGEIVSRGAFDLCPKCARRLAESIRQERSEIESAVNAAEKEQKE
jgi:hypothetical protein